MVYRGESIPRARPTGGGVLDEVVHQFADTYAFVRELVQNAIDAGATTAKIAIDETDELVQTSVADDGCGMTLAMLEGPLLTAFASGKEGATGKIGRYGVGFLSVFAPDPEKVIVSTHRSEGAHAVTLSPDRSYVIEELDPRTGSGTVVALVSRIPAEAREAHAKAVEQAALHWCRHVGIALTLSVNGEPPRRLDRPLSVEAPVSVHAERDGIRAVVGPRSATSDGGAAAGFYHSGLLLFETSVAPPAIAGVQYKLESASFTHTISRDGIRQDRAYDMGFTLAEELANFDLLEALEVAFASAAESADVGDDHDERYAALLFAAAGLLPAKKIRLRLASPMKDRRAITLHQAAEAAGRLFGARARSNLSDLAARQGYAIVILDREGVARRLLHQVARTPVNLIDESLTALWIVDEGERGAWLGAAVRDALRFVGMRVETVVFAKAEGLGSSRSTWLMSQPPVELAPGVRGWIARADPAPGTHLVVVADARPVIAATTARDRAAAAASSQDSRCSSSKGRRARPSIARCSPGSHRRNARR